METKLEKAKDKKDIAVPGITRDQLELWKRMYCPDATDDEMKVFAHVAKKTGLDPTVRQLYFVKRQTKRGPVATIQTGIDGLRVVAHRSGEYCGSDEPIFDIGEDGKPKKATVTVWRMVDKIRCPFVASARWGEYFPGQTENQFMWNKMPFGQLGKCAEALALRKGFPLECAGVYIQEEMAQAENGDTIAMPKSITTSSEIPKTEIKEAKKESDFHITKVKAVKRVQKDKKEIYRIITEMGDCWTDNLKIATIANGAQRDGELIRLSVVAEKNGVIKILSLEAVKNEPGKS